MAPQTPLFLPNTPHLFTSTPFYLLIHLKLALYGVTPLVASSHLTRLIRSVIIMTLSSILAFLTVQVTVSSNTSHSDLKELDIPCLALDHSKQTLPSFHTASPHAIISSLIDLSVTMIIVALCFSNHSFVSTMLTVCFLSPHPIQLSLM